MMADVNEGSLCENCNAMNVSLHTFVSTNYYGLQEIWSFAFKISTEISEEIFRITGAQPEIFLGRRGFVKLGHFNKHFIKKSRKKAPHGKILKFFLLDTLKTTF